ncbi:hypothetical protein DSECCO2_369350 [anaerobic digester metagenome]|jgi:hypothetical protein
MKKIYTLLPVLIILSLTPNAQNLILNPGCDDTLVEGEIPGWSELTGNKWTQRLENPAPNSGVAYFFPGADATAELGQVIDVSNDSSEIDSGTKIYYFTGYVRAFAQSPADESNIFIHFMNANNTLLTSFNFGPFTQTQTWLRIDSALSVPPGTRKVDVRLHSLRHNGTNNDGYYDGLYLGNAPLVGMPEIEHNINISIYPNPSDGLITISISGLFRKSQLSIQSINGRQLIRRQITEPQTVISINTLPPGVYIVRVLDNKGVQVQKFVKQ